MPKRNVNRKKLHLTENEKLLVDLHKLVAKRTIDSEKATGLLAWYMTHKEWSYRQLNLARILCNKDIVRKKAKVEDKKYYLYAITAGDKVKLGITTSIKDRIRDLQTANGDNLKCAWRFYVGTNRQYAYASEKRLHRAFKSHRERGEWFSIDCLSDVKKFKCEVRYKPTRKTATTTKTKQVKI